MESRALTDDNRQNPSTPPQTPPPQTPTPRPQPSQTPRTPPPGPGSGAFHLAATRTAALPTPWAWGLTAALVVVAGVVLFLARGSLLPALDRWLPAPSREAPAPEPEVVAVAPEEPEVEEDPGPVWTFTTVEEALEGLPERTEALIAEGREELPEFADLDSDDDSRALLIRNRWQPWGRIWLNRVGVLRRQLPPLEECRVHAAHEPTCDALAESFALLQEIPAAANVEAAEELLDRAAAVLEAHRLRLEGAEEEAEEAPAPAP